MRIKLDLQQVPETLVSQLAFDPEYDDIRSLISSVCDQIADSGSGTFVVDGFGDSSWPVDIRTDLPVLLEQLPSAIAAIRSQVQQFAIDFYEQGVERSIHFSLVDNAYALRCESLLDWQPTCEPSAIEKSKLLNLLRAIQIEFMKLISRSQQSERVRNCFADWESNENAV